MKTGFHVALYSFFLLILASSTTFADCQIDGTTPSGGNVITCPPPVQVEILSLSSLPVNTTQFDDEITIPPGGGVFVPVLTVAINTSNGNDFVRVFGEITSNDASALVTVGGNDTVIIDGGTLTTNGNFSDDALATGNNEDTVIVNSGSLLSLGGGNAISTGTESDTITINGGFFTGEVDAGSDDDIITVNGGEFDNFISAGSGNDQVIMNGGIFTGQGVILLGNEDDTLTLNTDIDLNGGNIQCSNGFDTVIFAMEVPGNRIGLITRQIENTDPDGGEVFINDLRYRLLDCEELIPDLKAGPDIPSTVPTLSEWGLIAMAGLLGLFSLMVIRKRSIA